MMVVAPDPPAERPTICGDVAEAESTKHSFYDDGLSDLTWLPKFQLDIQSIDSTDEPLHSNFACCRFLACNLFRILLRTKPLCLSEALCKLDSLYSSSLYGRSCYKTIECLVGELLTRCWFTKIPADGADQVCHDPRYTPHPDWTRHYERHAVGNTEESVSGHTCLMNIVECKCEGTQADVSPSAEQERTRDVLKVGRKKPEKRRASSSQPLQSKRKRIRRPAPVMQPEDPTPPEPFDMNLVLAWNLLAARQATFLFWLSLLRSCGGHGAA